MQQSPSMRAIAILTCLVLAPAAAHAGVDSEEPPGNPDVAPTTPPKSEDAAFWWSAGGTLGAAALIGGGALLYAVTQPQDQDPNYQPTRLLKVPLHNWGNGLMMTGAIASAFTPSFGEWYSHRFWTAGLGLRAAGAAIARLGTVHICGVDSNEYGCQGHNNDGLIVVGGLLYAGGIIYDIAHAGSAAREYNRDHATRVAVMPAALRGPSSTGYGVALGGRF
jgi:hypothetical protein